MSELKIVPMEVEHLTGVLEVEQQSFNDPWTEEIFHHEVTNNPFAYYVVALQGEDVVAYCGTWIVFEDCQITNVAVHPANRGQKIGDALMRHLIAHCQSHEVDRISLEVRVSNEVAQNLYRKYGFQDGGIRKNYYTDGPTTEDALVMWVELT